VTPYLGVRNAVRALDFYKEAFGAKERMRLAAPDGRVMHAEIEIEGGLVMIADEFPEKGLPSPQQLNGTPVIVHFYVKDVDATVGRAAAAGCRVVDPVADKFYGDRAGCVQDPFGHIWSFATHVEDVTPEEMEKRFRDMCSAGGK
jgi:PhnB protein